MLLLWPGSSFSFPPRRAVSSTLRPLLGPPPIGHPGPRGLVPVSERLSAPVPVQARQSPLPARGQQVLVARTATPLPAVRGLRVPRGSIKRPPRATAPCSSYRGAPAALSSPPPPWPPRASRHQGSHRSPRAVRTTAAAPGWPCGSRVLVLSTRPPRGPPEGGPFLPLATSTPGPWLTRGGQDNVADQLFPARSQGRGLGHLVGSRGQDAQAHAQLCPSRCDLGQVLPFWALASPGAGAVVRPSGATEKVLSSPRAGTPAL